MAVYTSSVPVQPGVFVPSGIDHLGLYWYLDMMIDTVGYQYAIEVEVQFEFRSLLRTFCSSLQSLLSRLSILCSMIALTVSSVVLMIT